MKYFKPLLFLTLFAMIGCKEKDFSGNYKVITVGNENVKQHGITLNIEMSELENRVSGVSACNSYSGNFIVNDNGSINLQPVMMSKMYCQDTHTIERNYHDHLYKVHTVKTTGQGIKLLDKDGNTLITAINNDAN